MKIAVIFDSLHPEWEDAEYKRAIEQKAEEAEYDVARALMAGGHDVRMIGFDLSQEQTDLRDLVHEFARDVIRPAAPEWDEKEETPWPIMKQAHELGLDTYSYPEEYGGGGVSDMVTQMIVTEELTWGCAGIAIAISATGLCATAMQQCGTAEQKAKTLLAQVDAHRELSSSLAHDDATANA